MKKLLGILISEQKGQALAMALCMLALGSLIIYPLLTLTHTSVKAGQSEESRMYEHYAANAGIMDGVLKLITDNPTIPPHGENWSHSYSIPNTNNRSVNVIISTIDQSNWKITSTATSSIGHGTELNCYVEESNYLPNAINTNSVTIGRDAVVNGNVQRNPDGFFSNRGTINGRIIEKPIEWPTIEEVTTLYLDEIAGAPTHEGDLTLDLGPETIADPYSLGPIYINGDLNIAYGDSAVRLDGLVYVNGSVEIESLVHVYMNDNTIFSQEALWISSDAIMHEYGCIVTASNLYFEPAYDPNACTILWSVEDVVGVGSTGAEIYGAAYSPISVTVARNSTLTYVEHPPGLSIPPLPEKFRISSWESSTN
ncbi:hypothetical protein ACFLYE_01075 [Chloroflexota bacterium]